MGFTSVFPKVTNLLASSGVKPSYITGLDSASVTLRSLARYLHSENFRSGGIAPSVSAMGVDAVNQLPSYLLEPLLSWSGWMSAPSPEALEHVSLETISRWVVSLYPKRQYPAVAIGSCNGAATHLCAALGIPWLPQTLLIAMRRFTDPDEPKQDLEWGKAPAQQLLSRNPDIWVYQMHDPNQDRIKIPRIGYFRIKRSRLGTQFEQFLQGNLVPGATIFLIECEYRWLSTQVGDRHVFQFGGTGKLSPEEYLHNSPQVAEFLKQQGSKHQGWDAPAPDGEWPESEWGFEPSLREDVERFARKHGYRIRRIVFCYPQDLSPLVADLHRWWYQKHNLPVDRLLIESFVYLQPRLAVRNGLVPFWTIFNDRASLEHLNQYLDTAKPYDEIYMTLFSNGLNAMGQASLEEWRSVFSRARSKGRFIGVDEQKYPRDIASYINHFTSLQKLDGHYPVPQSMTLEQLNAFLAQNGDRYSVRWLDHNSTFR
ncbi:MAG: hypothetical protein JOZ78_22405 [Chroococcidiopsidaceae cyanobacterium CP_BM_ER_R8_30]|nr:hypothetical protein [Chroococcidiopsidaceae cyanobacterium CP_BM_ER_R8_30]